MSDDVCDATDAHSVATASYVSTTEILEREARLLARRQLTRPGFWRPFVRRRILAAVLVVAVIVTLAVVTDGIGAAGAVRGIVLMLLALGALTAVDVWLTRRGILRAHRAVATAGCPPGTVVAARYTPQELTFSLPGQRFVLETTTLTGGVHEGGLLWLEQGELGGWVVPAELLGPHGLDVVRAVLGERLVER